eukprot:627763-Rhodomonas_salina.1
MYELAVTMNGLPTSGSPYAIRMDGTSLDKPASYAIGFGVKRAQIPVSSSFSIQSRDEFGNDLSTGGNLLTATLEHVESSHFEFLTVVDEQDGSFAVNYVPTVSGVYTLSVTRAKQHISGSPFTVSAVPSDVDADLTSVVGPWPSHLTAGVSSTICVSAQDSFGNEIDSTLERFAAVLEGPGGEEGSMQLEFLFDRPECAQMQITPYTSGKFTLSILFNSHHISASPIDVTVSAAGVATLSHLHQRNYARLTTAGQYLSLVLLAKDAFDNPVIDLSEPEISASTSDAVANIISTQTDPGRYRVRVQLTRSGRYPVTVLAGTVFAPSLQVQVNGGALSATRSLCINGTRSQAQQFTAGQAKRIGISAFDSYSNCVVDGPMLELQVLGPTQTTQVVQPEVQEACTYLVPFYATLAGDYTVDISHLASVISDCPLSIKVSAARVVLNQTFLHGSGLSAACVGSGATFISQARDSYGNQA